TDACIDWDTTVKAVRSMHAKVKDVLPQRKRARSTGPMDTAAGPARDPASVLSQPAGGTCHAPCGSRKGSPCNPAPLRTSAPRPPAVLPAPCPATPPERRYDRYPLSVYPDPCRSDRRALRHHRYRKSGLRYRAEPQPLNSWRPPTRAWKWDVTQIDRGRGGKIPPRPARQETPTPSAISSPMDSRQATTGIATVTTNMSL